MTRRERDLDRLPADAPFAERVEPGSHRALHEALARRALLVVGVTFFITQVALLPLDRPPTWDEAVYLTQVTPGMEGAYFHAWHARGITLIVAPVMWLGASVVHVRLFLMVLSSLATIAAFRVWIPLVGMAAVIAAFVTSFSWVSLFSASQVMPNYWAAILGVATTGLVVRGLERGETRYVVGASLLMAGMALVRPTEATLLTSAIALIVLLVRGDAWRQVVSLGAGLLLGWLPWAIEMSVRFGGVEGAIRRAGEGQRFRVVPIAENVLHHLALTGGRRSPSVVGGVIWWGLIICTGIVGVVRPLGSRSRAASLLCCVGALVLAAEYLMFVPAITPRFLLPAYALASLAGAIGVVALMQGRNLATFVGATVLVLLLPWAIWQSSVAERQASGSTLATDLPSRVGSKMQELADGHPCFFLTTVSYPEIALASRCQGQRHVGVPSKSYVEEIRRGRETFVILLRKAPRSAALASLRPVRFPGHPRDWYLYQLSDAVPSRRTQAVSRVPSLHPRSSTVRSSRHMTADDRKRSS